MTRFVLQHEKTVMRIYVVGINEDRKCGIHSSKNKNFYPILHHQETSSEM